jgi:predicted Zn-ribbon and HTH transcriptional regulator
MKKAKEPAVPLERRDTVRHEIVSALKGRTLSARDISAEVHITEKEVYEHLEHIRKSANKKDLTLSIDPAECLKCGFVFRKREKLKKPGRCPVCRGEQIQDPLFSIPALGETKK